MEGPIASFASGYISLLPLQEHEMPCDEVRQALSRRLQSKMFSSQSSDTTVLKSTTSPFTSPAQAALASPR